MNNQVDIIFITNLPSFYKINLYNQIARHKKILVVFTHDKSADRNDDFYKGNIEFDFISLAKKSLPFKIVSLVDVLISVHYQQLFICGWDQLLLWIAAFTSKRKKNSVVIESSIYESKVSGIKGLIKRFFLSRNSNAYVSGKSQNDLCLKLGFKGQIIKTKGVGIFNIRPQQEYKTVSSINSFIYVGRLSPEKNVEKLIRTFSELPELTLNIVGFGPLDSYLKSIASDNVIFHGAIPNAELYKFYLQNDVFVLPSISEPWGMVVEEAFNCGLPVIVSDKVGCAEEIVNTSNGIVYKSQDTKGLYNAIVKMTAVQFYNQLKYNVSKMDFNKISSEQVECYLR